MLDREEGNATSARGDGARAIPVPGDDSRHGPEASADRPGTQADQEIQ
jgi:hypothetical protein